MTTLVPRHDLDGLGTTAAPNLFVIPAYNEEQNLPRLFSDLEANPDLFTPGSRLIIVDDGSGDGTVEVMRAYRGWLPLEPVVMPRNGGPGAAFRAGFAEALRHATPDALVVTLEADTTSDLGALPLMLRRAELGADLVLASVHGGGKMLGVSRTRRLLSRGAGFVARRTLGLDARTVSSFFRVYRASILQAAVDRYGDGLIRECGFACKAELLAKLTALGAQVEEVPVDLDASRRMGESKMPVFETMLAYWRLSARGVDGEPERS